MNPHFNSFDEINFDKLLDIAPLLDMIKAPIWVHLLVKFWRIYSDSSNSSKFPFTVLVDQSIGASQN